MQILLFNNLPKLSLEEQLQPYIKRGQLFLSINQTKKMLNLTYNQIRTLIHLFRLDALCIGKDYKIPWTAIIDYEREKEFIYKQFYTYIKWTEYREIKGLLPFYKAIYLGENFEEAKTCLLEKNKNIDSSLFNEILNNDLPSIPKETELENLEDWYELQRLNIPFKVSKEDLATILNVKPKIIARELNQTGNHTSYYQWPIVYDWLISKELINLPTGYRLPLTKESKIEENNQLSLF